MLKEGATTCPANSTNVSCTRDRIVDIPLNPAPDENRLFTDRKIACMEYLNPWGLMTGVSWWFFFEVPTSQCVSLRLQVLF